MSNDITLVLLLEFHSVPFIVSLDTPTVTVDAGLVCDKAVVFGDRIKETSCSDLQERTASPAPLFCKRLCAVCLHSATGPAVTDCWTCSCTFLFCTADGTYTMVMAAAAAAACISSNHEWWISSQSLFAELSRGWTESVLSLSFIVCPSVCLSVLNNLQRSLFRGQHDANRIHNFVSELQLFFIHL